MRKMFAAAIALASVAALPASAQVLYQWPASSTSISYVGNCPIRVTGGYAQMVGEPTARVIVQMMNQDTARAREVRMQVSYVSQNGTARREGNFGPFRVASNNVAEVRTLSLPPGMPTGSTLTIRVTSCTQA
ncbi:MAG: hypothetical protein K2X11_11165 [Acetobacteraceae bacterium]|nr:hypothetical protein [Acetobacteraceae bacterium]